MQHRALAILSAVTGLAMVAAASINWMGWLVWAFSLALATACGAFAGLLWHYSLDESVTPADSGNEAPTAQAPAEPTV
jgi:hypothetical protein